MFVAGYVGTHGSARALERLFEPVQTLQQMPNAQTVRFLFLGDGARKQDLNASTHVVGLRNGLLVELVQMDKVVRYWSVLDSITIHLRKTVEH
jgi:hypothetical protein